MRRRIRRWERTEEELVEEEEEEERSWSNPLQMIRGRLFPSLNPRGNPHFKAWLSSSEEAPFLPARTCK